MSEGEETHDEEAWWRQGAIDLGLDHWAKPTTHEGHEVGFLVAHRKPNGEMCWGSITIASEYTRTIYPKREGWTLESRDPLTVSPSLRCSCGDHGFIRGGKWVPV